MAINTAGQARSQTTQSVVNQVIGTITFDATAVVTTDYTQIDMGFEAAYIYIMNVTDRTSLEWFKGMPANTWIKTISAGTQTLDTTAGALVINPRNVQVLQNAALGVILASKVLSYRISGI